MYLTYFDIYMRDGFPLVMYVSCMYVSHRDDSRCEYHGSCKGCHVDVAIAIWGCHVSSILLAHNHRDWSERTLIVRF